MSKIQRQIARDITYASEAKGKPGRAMIRVMENATGRLRLIKRAQGYLDEVAQGGDFWQIMADRYGLSLDVVGGSLDNIPTTGPLITVANHPYGILDGLMKGYILSQRRQGEFKVLANTVFKNSPDLDKIILPISFHETKEAAKANLATRNAAIKYLQSGGAVGVFPGGTVSTANSTRSKAMDPTWRNFTAKMIAKSDAVVVPIFFDGTNSRLFQAASRMHSNLRMGLLIREFKRQTNKPVRVVIGTPIPRAELDALKSNPTALMDYLRKATYELSPKPIDPSLIGYEFEEKYRKRDNGSGHIR